MCVCGQKIILCSSAHNSHNHLQVDLTNPSTQIVTITWHEICVRMNSANVLAARLYIFLLSKFEWTKEKKIKIWSCDSHAKILEYYLSTYNLHLLTWTSKLFLCRYTLHLCIIIMKLLMQKKMIWTRLNEWYVDLLQEYDLKKSWKLWKNLHQRLELTHS